jgi:glycosyltransferase involved in cell wall biosynthesis
MRLVYFIPSLYNPGGMERVLTEKLNYLSAIEGYELTVITTEQNARIPYFSIDPRVKLLHLDINYNSDFNKGIIARVLSKRKKDIQYRMLLTNFLSVYKADICISLGGKEISILPTLKDESIKILELHFAKSFRAQFISSRNSGVIWKLIGKLRTWQLIQESKKFRKVVALTEHDKSDWQKTNSNVIQIYNPTPFTVGRDSDLSKLKVLSVGKLDAQKGYDFLIEIWSHVAKKHPTWILEIFGQGEWDDKLQKQINNSGLQRQVQLKGLSKNVRQEYLNSSIYVMTSRYEGFPMVLLEALACGLPCISFDCKYGPNELIRNGENGFLIPEWEIQLFADKICELISDEELRNTMSLNSLRFAEQFTIDKIMKEWTSLFNNLLSESNSDNFSQKKGL